MKEFMLESLFPGLSKCTRGGDRNQLSLTKNNNINNQL